MSSFWKKGARGEQGSNKQALGMGFTTHVNYDKFNPTHDASTEARKSLTDLDYSPLRRVTWASFFMAVLVSMGGFSKFTQLRVRDRELTA